MSARDPVWQLSHRALSGGGEKKESNALKVRPNLTCTPTTIGRILNLQ